MWKTILRIQRWSRDRIRNVISAKLEVSKRDGPGDAGDSSYEAMSGIWTQTPTDSCLPQRLYAAAMPLIKLANHDGGVDDLQPTGKFGGCYKLPPQQW